MHYLLDLGVALGAAIILLLGARLLSSSRSAADRESDQYILGPLMLAWMLLTAYRADHGLHAGWPLEAQTLLVLAMALSMIWGLALIAGGIVGTLPRGAARTEAGHSDDDPYFASYAGPMTLAITILAAGLYLHGRLGIETLHGCLFAAGVAALILSAAWPRWFAGHHIVDGLVHRLTPIGGRILLAVLGMAGMAFGIYLAAGFAT